MTKDEYVEVLKRVLSDKVVDSLMTARVGIVRITNLAAVHLFQWEQCGTVEAGVIREQLNNMDAYGHFIFTD